MENFNLVRLHGTEIHDTSREGKKNQEGLSLSASAQPGYHCLTTAILDNLG
jgi:hypothetical protein